MPKWVSHAELLLTLVLPAAADAKQFPEDYNGREIIAHLSFSEEFAARSWAQVSGSQANRFRQKLMIVTGIVTLP